MTKENYANAQRTKNFCLEAFSFNEWNHWMIGIENMPGDADETWSLRNIN